MVELKAIGLWFLILVLAVMNGGFREFVLLKVFSHSTAYTVSGLLLIACVLIVALVSIGWLGKLTFPQYALIGLQWLIFTVVFEFAFGLLVRGESLTALLQAYRYREGNIWPVVLLAVAVAPVLAAYVRGFASVRGGR